MLIPVSKPWITELERQYVNRCLDSSYISHHSKYHTWLEESLAEYCETKHCVLFANGSVACYSLIKACCPPTSTILTPSLTYVATANSIIHAECKPIFIDSEHTTWNMDYDLLEDAIQKSTSAIFYVDLFGNPNDVKKLDRFATKYDLQLLGDCCESFAGSNTEGKVGAFSDGAAFSGYSNKTTSFGGEGGFVVCNDEGLREELEGIKGQYQSGENYNHIGIGWNFRLTGIQAAFGLAQLHRIEEIQVEKERVYQKYVDLLKDYVIIQDVNNGCIHSKWVFACLVDDRIKVRDSLKKEGIESRPFFKPIHTLPMYINNSFISDSSDLPGISETLYQTGIILPSYCELKDEEIEKICEIVKGCQ